MKYPAANSALLDCDSIVQKERASELLGFSAGTLASDTLSPVSVHLALPGHLPCGTTPEEASVRLVKLSRLCHRKLILSDSPKPFWRFPQLTGLLQEARVRALKSNLLPHFLSLPFFSKPRWIFYLPFTPGRNPLSSLPHNCRLPAQCFPKWSPQTSGFRITQELVTRAES